MPNGRLEHVNIRVSDPDRTAAFLAGLTGWRDAATLIKFAPSSAAILRDGGRCSNHTALMTSSPAATSRLGMIGSGPLVTISRVSGPVARAVTSVRSSLPTTVRRPAGGAP